MYRKTLLENGISVISESLSHFRSVTLGIWVKVGSRDEGKGEEGLCHFIEHMAFKGTEKRSAFDIAKEIEAVGGTLNAFTTKEYTCFHAKVLAKDMVLALDILSDIVSHPLFDPEEMERERGVVLQEIKSIEDQPEELVQELFYARFWKDHPLGHSIAGSEETVKSFDRQRVKEFFVRYWRPEVMIVAAVGALDHKELVEQVRRTLGELEPGDGVPRRLPPKDTGKGKEAFSKDLEQVHLCIGFNGFPQTAPERYPALVFNALFGGNMSSRLFQEVREKRGLAYSVYSFLRGYSDAGLFGVYVGTTKSEVNRVFEVLQREFERAQKGEFAEEEVRVAKEYLKGGLLLGLESTEERMIHLAKSEIYFGKYVPIEETIEKIEAVKLDDVREVSRSILANDPCLVLLGDVEGL